MSIFKTSIVIISESHLCFINPLIIALLMKLLNLFIFFLMILSINVSASRDPLLYCNIEGKTFYEVHSDMHLNGITEQYLIDRTSSRAERKIKLTYQMTFDEFTTPLPEKFIYEFVPWQEKYVMKKAEINPSDVAYYRFAQVSPEGLRLIAMLNKKREILVNFLVLPNHKDIPLICD